MAEPEKKTYSSVAAMREFFADSRKPLTLAEIKALSAEEREEIGAMCAKALGKEIVNPK